MPCENYREALIEAAAADSAPSPELRSHLDACTFCRAAFTEELQLFAAIDAGLRTTSNAEVPDSLFPRVRVQWNERPVPRRSWVPAGAAMAAAVAAIAVVVFVRGMGRDTAVPIPKASSVSHLASPAEIQPVPRKQGFSESTGPLEGNRQGRTVKMAPVVVTQVAAARVFVPGGQKRAIEALLASVQQGKVDGEVLLAEKPEKALEELRFTPLDISPIEMKPLADLGAESAASPNGKTRR